MLYIYSHFCWSNQEIDVSCVIQNGVYLTLFFWQLVATFQGEGNGNPLQYSCLENPMDGGAGGLQSMGWWRVGHDWVTSISLFTYMHWRRKWQPTPVFLPRKSQGRGSMVGCRLWGYSESDTTDVTQQQQQPLFLGFPGGSVVKNLPAVQETQETRVWSLGGEHPLEGKHGNLLHYSCLETPVDRGA